MTSYLIAFALAFGAAAPPDTLFAVQPGDLLVIAGFSGEVRVVVQEGSSVRLISERQDEVGFSVTREGRRFLARVVGRKGRDKGRIRVSVPAWLAVEISGPEFDANVRGITGGVKLHTGEGELVIRDVEGDIVARTLNGDITIRNARGSIDVFSGDDDVTLENVEGDVKVEAIDGDLELLGIRGGKVEASTVDGSITFTGSINQNGDYYLATHSGDIDLSLWEPVHADLLITAYEGEVSSDFRMRVSRYGAGEQLRFTVGDGGASVVVEAFDGDVGIRRSDRRRE